MFDQTLFLAVQVDSDLNKSILENDQYVVSMIFAGGDYLTKIIVNDTHYIGKPLDNCITLSVLEDVERHLVSLVKKLSPTFSLEKNQPILLTVCSKT